MWTTFCKNGRRLDVWRPLWCWPLGLDVMHSDCGGGGRMPFRFAVGVPDGDAVLPGMLCVYNSRGNASPTRDLPFTEGKMCVR